MKKRLPNISRAQFDLACEALWTEMEYVNNLPRRTDDEAQDLPGFLTLARVYLRNTENAWADNAAKRFGVTRVDAVGGQFLEMTTQVPEALDGLRKTATILLRAMLFNGVQNR